MTLQERLTLLAQAIGADMKGKAPSVHAHANATPSAAGFMSAQDKAKLDALSSDVTGLDAALSGKEPAISAGTTAQYWRGDKTWQTLNKSAVGLGNVDNTSDADKPVSTAQAAAIATATAIHPFLLIGA